MMMMMMMRSDYLDRFVLGQALPEREVRRAS